MAETSNASEIDVNLGASALDVILSRLNEFGPRKQYSRAFFVGRIAEGFSMAEVGQFHDRVIQSVEGGSFSGLTILQKHCVVT